MDSDLVGGSADPPVHNGGVFALFLNCADSFLPFLRLGRNSNPIGFVPADLLLPSRYPSHFQPHFLINFACVLPFSPRAVPAPGLHGGVVLPLVRSCHGGTSPGAVSLSDGNSVVEKPFATFLLSV